MSMDGDSIQSMKDVVDRRMDRFPQIKLLSDESLGNLLNREMFIGSENGMQLFEVPDDAILCNSSEEMKRAIEQNAEKINRLLQISLENKTFFLSLTGGATAVNNYLDKTDALAILLSVNINFPIRDESSLQNLETNLADNDKRAKEAFVSISL